MIPREDGRLLLSDLLGAPVVEGSRQIGHVLDVRFVLDGAPGPLLATPRMLGIIVGARRRLGFLGYEREDMHAPALLARVLRRRVREAHLVDMADVVELADGRVVVREGHRRWATTLAE